MEKKNILMITALGIFILASVPSAMFHKAVKKYFNFLYSWDVAVLKLNRTNALPKPHKKPHMTAEVPHPELRFVKFSIKAPKAKSVKIAADFNRWKSNDLVLVKDGREWKSIVTLPSGTYKYLYKVDEKFILDPLNPDTSHYDKQKVSLLTVK